MSFVAAKAFVAPLKFKTTPRLELMAFQTMSRLVLEIENSTNYELESKTFWTDSLIVIHWLNSESRRYKPFISSRIQEILDTHKRIREEIRYIPSDLNPADALTKPIETKDLLEWHEGPTFLILPFEEWPENTLTFEYEENKTVLEEKPHET